MKFTETLRTATFSLRGNWLRSALTSLGVIIGIAAVIVMVSVGQGTQAEIDKLVSGLGSNRLLARLFAGRGYTGHIMPLQGPDRWVASAGRDDGLEVLPGDAFHGH